jgi:hypothetical protein
MLDHDNQCLSNSSDWKTGKVNNAGESESTFRQQDLGHLLYPGIKQLINELLELCYYW